VIYRSHSDFKTACTENLNAALKDPTSSQKTMMWEIGDPLKGHFLSVDDHGWFTSLEGVITNSGVHIAAPLSNFQSAVVAL
jgi:hypothetical protein